MNEPPRAIRARQTPMPRTKRRRPNWPYRLAWLGLIGSIVTYVLIRTLSVYFGIGHGARHHDWGIAFISSCLDATIAAWFAVVGACIGSFLNVVAYRLPIGRNVGGHSGCPFCCAAIRGADNVPVLAWMKLRGRCRNCHLPISAQYPLVEFAVAVVFLIVYFTEFARNAANLPGNHVNTFGAGLMRVNVTNELIVRTVGYLVLLSGLVAAALIAAKKQRVPLTLYAWALVPFLLGAILLPSTLPVAWRAEPATAGLPQRIDVLISILCGAAAGITVARLLAPTLVGPFDRKLISSDPATNRARQLIGGFAAVGALIGWQSVVVWSWITVGCACFASLVLRRFRDRVVLADLTVWLWLGLLVFRANWNWLIDLQLLPSFVPEVLRHVLSAILLVPVCWFCVRRSAAAANDRAWLQDDTTMGQPVVEPSADEQLAGDRP